MKQTDRKTEGATSRRTFLKTLAATGGGVAALAVSGNAAADIEPPKAEATTEKLGYRETEHIRDYYAKADF